MTYGPTVWVDYGVPCIDAANLNNMEAGIDRAQGDVMVLYDTTANIPASDPLLIGRLYIETDLLERMWRDNGAGWDLVPTGGAVNYRRYLWNHPDSIGSGVMAQISVVGRTFYSPIDVPFDMTIDRLIYFTYVNNAVGNIRMALYEEGPVADDPSGGNLMVQSASVAVPGISQIVQVTVANTALTQGLHYLAIRGDDTLTRFWAVYDQSSGLPYLFDAGAYVVYADPCPVVAPYTRVVSMGVRVV